MSRVDVVRAQVQVSRCDRCQLAGTNTPMVGPADPAYSVMGEAPGNREVQRGEPFIGPAGRRLRRSLERHGLDPDAGAYLNAISCLPPRNPPTPTPAEIGACTPNRKAQLAAASDWLLVCGGTALGTIRGDVGIGNAWGVPLIRGETVIVPCVHPSYVLRNPAEQWKIDKAVSLFADLVLGRGIAGRFLLGEWCLKCRRPAEVWDKDWWPWCGKHAPKELTDEQRRKKMAKARTRANRKKQEVMFDG